MNRIMIFIALLSLCAILQSQSLADMNFGDSASLDIMTWNIEWFPKNGQTTVDSVATVLEALDMDIYAIQEVDDTLAFREMVNELDDYSCFFESSYFAGLAYIYKTDEIQIDYIEEIYTSYPYWRPFPRSPVVMKFLYNGQIFYVMNNHFKAMGDGHLNLNDEWDEETRRYDASLLIKEYIDDDLPNANVIVLGDLNDILTDEEDDNVFQCFLDDEENYLFADYEIATSSSSEWSYPGWPSHLDHILVTNEVFTPNSNVITQTQTLKIYEYMQSFSQYDSYISDHLPVAIKIIAATDNDDSQVCTNASFNLTNYPNPFNPETTISFNNPSSGHVKLTIFNIKGQILATIINSKLAKGQHNFVWNGKDSNGNQVSSNIYFAKVESKDASEIHKIILLK